MSQHWIYINSPAYRRFVEASKHNRWLLWGATLALGGAASLAASATMSLTNPRMEEEGARRRDDELARLPLQAQLVARSNREQLRAMLTDVTAGTDRARYADLLNGKIHKTSHGTSLRPLGDNAYGTSGSSSSGSSGAGAAAAGAAGGRAGKETRG